jgi:hypothetical protein
MDRELFKKECLKLDIETYNKAKELQWEKDKIKKNLYGDLSNCKYCGRKYIVYVIKLKKNGKIL